MIRWDIFGFILCNDIMHKLWLQCEVLNQWLMFLSLCVRRNGWQIASLINTIIQPLLWLYLLMWVDLPFLVLVLNKQYYYLSLFGFWVMIKDGIWNLDITICVNIVCSIFLGLKVKYLNLLVWTKTCVLAWNLYLKFYFTVTV